MEEKDVKDVKEKTKTKKEEKKANKETCELEKIKKELDEYKDKYYRTLADLDNQRKLYDRDYRNALKYSSQNLAEKLIPSFEMFSMVLENSDKLPQEVQAYMQGFSMIHRQMVSAFEAEGIKEIECKIGDKFNHEIHNAMETEYVDDDSKVDTITKIISKGYMIHDRLIKPVTVIVAKKKEEVKEDKEEVKEETSDNTKA